MSMYFIFALVSESQHHSRRVMLAFVSLGPDGLAL
jgi:hypothetical protein